MIALNYIESFFRQSILSFKALFGWLDPKIYLLIKVINPVFQLLFFVLLAKYVYNAEDVTPWVIGNAFLLCTSNAIFGVGNVLANERNFGTLKIVVASPANKFLVFVGRAFMHIFDAMITVMIGLLTGMLVFGVSFSGVNIPLFILTIMVSMFAASGLGLLIGSLGLRIRDMNLVMNTAAMGLLALSGANFPISQLPAFLGIVSYGIPLTRSIQAARLIVDNGNSQLIYKLISQEFIIGIIYILAGYLLLRIMELNARKTATLDIY